MTQNYTALDRAHHHAARWLEKARAAYRTAGHDTEWPAYLTELIARHQRKHSSAFVAQHVSDEHGRLLKFDPTSKRKECA